MDIPEMESVEDISLRKEIVKEIIVSIEGHNLTAFRKAFEQYMQYYYDDGKNFVVDDDKRRKRINDNVLSLLSDAEADDMWDISDIEGKSVFVNSLRRDEHRPILIILKTLMSLNPIAHFQEYLGFAEEFVKEFRPNMNKSFVIVDTSYTPLGYFISRSNHVSDEKCRHIIDALVRWGADLTCKKTNPLLCAVVEGNPVCFHYLLAKHANFTNNRVNDQGDDRQEESPLFYAVTEKRASILSALLESSDRLHYTIVYTSSNGNNVLHDAILNFETEDGYEFDAAFDIMNILINFLNTRDDDVFDLLSLARNRDGMLPVQLLPMKIIPGIQKAIADAQRQCTMYPEHAMKFIFDNAFSRKQRYERGLDLARRCWPYLEPKNDHHINTRLALAMSQSQRLGQNSHLHRLDGHLLQMIAHLRT